MLFSFCGISEHWYKECLRNVTGSSGHSRPSGRSSRTLYHFDDMDSCSRTFRGPCRRRRGDTWNHASARPAMLLQLLLPPSPPWHVALVPLWPQSSSTRVGPGTSWLFTGASVGVLAAVCFPAYTVVFALFVHQGIVLYCGSSVRGGHFVTRGQIMLWTGVQYCLHCLRPSRNHWGRIRTMTFLLTICIERWRFKREF